MRITFERRLEPSRKIALLVPVVSFVLALVVGGILLLAAGADPIQTYKAMFEGAFGTTYARSETLVKAIPLMLTGLAVSIAFRMLFWNIGAEGQLVMGAIATAWIPLFALKNNDLPTWSLLAIMGAAAFIAGALWGLIPALLKAYLKVNEIITTLMLNYVAILMLDHLYTGPWKDKQGFGFPGTASFRDIAVLPRLPTEIDAGPIHLSLNAGRVHLGLIIAVAAAVFIWLVLARTKWGYEIRVIGENPTAARYAGISLTRNFLLVMVISGGLAALAGYGQVAGIAHRLQKGIAVGDGFTAIIVAWLAKLHPIGVLVVAILMAALSVGGDQIMITMRLPAAVASVLQGTILFFVLGGEIFVRYRFPIFDVWGRAITRPLMETYTALLQDEPAPTLRKALGWVAVAALIVGPISAVLGGTFTLMLLAPLTILLGFVVSSVLLLAIARVLGGQGNLGRQSYLLAALQAPLQMISGLVGVVLVLAGAVSETAGVIASRCLLASLIALWLNVLALLLTRRHKLDVAALAALLLVAAIGGAVVPLAALYLLAGLYVLWLNALALQAAHRYPLSKALLTVLLPSIIALPLLVVVL
jgi:simple sugar transport system permease protein